MSSSFADCVTLRNGYSIPLLGLGVLAMSPQATLLAVRQALEAGYRHFDTAAAYANEAEVGEALRQSDVPRSEVFITTKVWNARQGFDATMRAFDESQRAMDLEYVDLYLVHWPFPGDLEGTWRAVERVYAEGRAKAIGVCNFLAHHLDRLAVSASVAPMVNQVEFHPLLQQPDLLRFCRTQEIQVEAWRPIMRGDVNEIPLLRTLADRHGKTPVQVVLRWMLQKQIVTLPKTVRPDRMRENADIFDFALSAEDMASVEALDEGRRFGQDPDTFRPPQESMPQMPWMAEP